MNSMQRSLDAAIRSAKANTPAPHPLSEASPAQPSSISLVKPAPVASDFDEWLETDEGAAFHAWKFTAGTQVRFATAVDALWTAAVDDIVDDWVTTHGPLLEQLTALSKGSGAEVDVAAAGFEALRQHSRTELGFYPLDQADRPRWQPPETRAYLSGVTRHISAVTADHRGHHTLPDLAHVDCVPIESIVSTRLRTILRELFPDD